MTRCRSHAAAITLDSVAVSFAKSPVLTDVSATIHSGELMAIVGPNGAGKSTLMQTIQGFVKPDHGSIQVFGQACHKVRRKISYMPQRNKIDWDFPTTVRDVVTMGRYGHLGWFRRPGRHERRLADGAIEQVELSAYADRQIGSLSGGQQQRVFLARALIQEADLYLMDEPLVGIDAASERAIITQLKQLHNAGKTVVVVHHDLHTLHAYFDSVLLLNRRIIALGEIASTVTEKNLDTTYEGRVIGLPAALVGANDG